MNFKKEIVFLSILLAFVLISSCKKYDNPPPVFEDDGNGVQIENARKVLIISIDGATGSEINAIAPPNIKSLQKTSKYTYSMLKEEFTTDASSWASMMTGVGYFKHRIKDESFLSSGHDDNEHEEISFFPNSLNYVLQYNPQYKSAIVSPWNELVKFSKIADYRVSVSSDVVVKDSAINILKDNNLGVLVLNFKEVATAGLSGSFSAGDPGYKAAVLKTDGYVGMLIEAVKSRKAYAREDWLIIVTTNHGGSEADPKSGFIVCSNPKLKEGELKKSGFNTVQFNNATINATAKSDNGLYDAGSDKDFTVQIQTKFNKGSAYPGFFSKSNGLSGSRSTGWTMFLSGPNYGVIFGGADNGGAGRIQFGGGVVGDGNWHTITMSVKTIGATRMATLYIDGVLDGTINIAGTNNLSIPSEPLQIGYKTVDETGKDLDFYAADVCYFNTALDAAVIAANVGLKDMKNHPNYTSLKGYWPLNDGGGSTVVNLAPGGHDMTVAGPYKWKALGVDVPVSMEADQSKNKSVVATTPDLSALMLYWLRIPILPDWNFDGNPWLQNFETEILAQ